MPDPDPSAAPAIRLTGLRKTYAAVGRVRATLVLVAVLAVLLVGGGIATATEVSAIAVVYAFLIGAVLYGGIPARRIVPMLVETVAMSGAILLILGTASAMSWALTQSGFARDLTATMTALPGGAATVATDTTAAHDATGNAIGHHPVPPEKL